MSERITIDIDDHYSSSSKLTLEEVHELESVQFTANLQHGGTSIFYMWEGDIDKVIEFLSKFKEKCQKKK